MCIWYHMMLPLSEDEASGVVRVGLHVHYP